MKKIAIKDLLNPPSQSQEVTPLEKIKNELLQLYKHLLDTTTKNTTDNYLQTHHILKKISEIQMGINFNKQNSREIGEIQQLCHLILSFINDDISPEKLAELSKKCSAKNNKNQLKQKKRNKNSSFRIVKQNIKNEELVELKSYQGQRLSKKNIGILEQWYEDNIDYPYLSSQDIKFLMTETDLSSTQIKNWASNRRRKKRQTIISSEISNVLFDK
ncbi:homeobox domain-containing protein SCDLUD_004055 [Saccharomycodes ludwigii]|uniref:homeobox domain-containing protein n=1 Tax=Saccharomycodes ludwigii TaxID=36035 RepID=UPI001E853C64|nr:hypothetical protein SCDLUD_004055 [Saccharomycodes ludwigii]KAH3899767.1 hypothetical protein SCDLUD_004055 [Saccharomycodes ludwigii]